MNSTINIATSTWVFTRPTFPLRREALILHVDCGVSQLPRTRLARHLDASRETPSDKSAAELCVLLFFALSQYHGYRCGPEAASADQVPTRVQSESRHEEGQRRGAEKVSCCDRRRLCRALVD